MTDSEGGATRGLTFAAQGTLLFVSGRQPTTHYQDFTIYAVPSTGAPSPLFSTTIPATQNRGLRDILAIRSDGRAFAVDDGGDAASHITIWTSANPSAPEPLSSPDGSPFDLGDAAGDVAFSPDGRTLALTKDATHSDRQILYFLDASNLQHIPITSQHDIGSISAPLVFNPGGQLLLAPGVDTSAALWDVRDRAAPTLAAALPTRSQVTAAAFSANGSLLATGEENGTVKLWKVGAGQNPTMLGPLTTRESEITQLSFDPRSGLLAVADGSTVQLWKPN
ncbi:WD40 repeat domain-containing protein [Streptomyces sp. NPDC054783]